MKAFPVMPGTWEAYETVTGHGRKGELTFPLRVVEIIGRTYGLTFVSFLPEADAVFLAVHDFSSLALSAKALRLAGVEPDAKKRDLSPMVWAGGQGCFNPLPLAGIADLVVLGDAEDSLPELLRLWNAHGNTVQFLDAAACVSGVFVPSIHDENKDRLRRGFSRDISASMKERIGITGEHARVEISRGCASKCSFCGLGWQGPVRHNSYQQLMATVNGCSAVHLQAGDAEAHPEIRRIRYALSAQGTVDIGCTSRLDSCAKAESSFLFAKTFNFGVEALTERVRCAVGKPQLTNERIAQWMLDLYARLRCYGASSGRIAWHMIAGLPGEIPADASELAGVLRAIDSGLFRAHSVAQLEIRWQPLFPSPGTPMQWCAAAGDTVVWCRALRDACRDIRFLRITHRAGRREATNVDLTRLARSFRNGTSLGDGPLADDTALPWDFIEGHYQRSLLEKAHRKMMRDVC